MRIAKIKDDRVVLSFEYNPTLSTMIKRMAGRRFHLTGRYWSLPLINMSDHLKTLKELNFNIDPEIIKSLADQERQAIESEGLREADDTQFESPLPLFPYQRVGCRFIDTIKSGIIGDEVGIGKTLQAIALAESPVTEPGKILILCPAILKYQWENEFKKFLPTAAVQVIDGNAEERMDQWKEDAKYYIANYELLLRDSVISLRKWSMVIADEATRISNPRSKTAKALKNLATIRKVALTGTPLSNRPQEVWSIVDWVQPGYLGDYWHFINRYCVKNEWGSIVSYMNLDELKLKLKRVMIRRMKKDVLTELPDKIITDVPFKLSDEEADLYKKIKQEILFEIESADISKIQDPIMIQHTLVKMVRLRQLTGSLELLGENKTSTKLEVLKQLLEDMAVDGKMPKVIIFSEFSQMCDILTQNLDLYGALKITGDVGAVQRQEVLKQFNQDPSKNILVMSSAGQYGLNIQAASVIIHYDMPWSLAKLVQREGRAHRLGQKETVMVYNLIAKGTLDMYMHKVLFKKQKLAEDLLGDPAFNMEDIKQMLTWEGK